MSSGASFMLLSGCDPKAFNDLSTYFEKEGYTETDVAELDRYNALCLIKNEDTNYSAFVVDCTLKKQEGIIMLERHIDLSMNLNEDDLFEVIVDYIEYNRVTIEDVELIENLGFNINEFNSYLLN